MATGSSSSTTSCVASSMSPRVPSAWRRRGGRVLRCPAGAAVVVGGRVSGVARLIAAAARGDDQDGRQPDGHAPPAHDRFTRMRPSCTTVATSRPSAVKIAPRPKPAPLGRRRRVLAVEQPFVGSEGPVEPHRVVEAGHEQVGGAPAAAVGEQRGVEQRHVAGVGEDARVEDRIVGQATVGAQPHTLVRRQGLAAVRRVPVDVAHVDGSGPGEVVAQHVLVRPHPLLEPGQILRAGACPASASGARGPPRAPGSSTAG